MLEERGKHNWGSTRADCVFGIGLVQVRSKLFVGKPTPKPKSNGTQTCPTQIVNSQPKCNLVDWGPLSEGQVFDNFWGWLASQSA